MDVRLSLVALDCPEPLALARFYSDLTGWPIGRTDADWVELDADGTVTIAFQLAPDHVPPVWPSSDHPQQLHLDFEVDDLEAGEEFAVSIGAVKTDFQPSDNWTVFLDPAGHPFCLVRT